MWGWPRRPASTRTSCPASPAAGRAGRGVGHRAPGSAARRAAVPRWNAQGPAAAAEQIRTLQQRLGSHTLFRHHDQEEALSRADRVGVMERRLEQIARRTTVHRPGHRVSWPSSSAWMNRIPGELQAAIRSPRWEARSRSGTAPVQTAVDVLVRPEGLRLEVVRERQRDRDDRTFLGSVTRSACSCPGRCRVQVDRPSAEPPRWPRARPSRCRCRHPVLVAAAGSADDVGRMPAIVSRMSGASACSRSRGCLAAGQTAGPIAAPGRRPTRCHWRCRRPRPARRRRRAHRSSAVSGSRPRPARPETPKSPRRGGTAPVDSPPGELVGSASLVTGENPVARPDAHARVAQPHDVSSPRRTARIAPPRTAAA